MFQNNLIQAVETFFMNLRIVASKRSRNVFIPQRGKNKRTCTKGILPMQYKSLEYGDV